MYIEKAIVHYDQKLTVTVDDGTMTIIDENANALTLNPDEFRDLQQLAKLLNWELILG